MTAEETGLNRSLEAQGLEVAETDLGEWIVQLRREAPSHMVLPAIHLSREQVAELFSGVTGRELEPEVEQLVKVARRELRRRFAEADMGVTGANFAVAESGTIGIVTNEGNARLVSTLPRVHVALVGLDKLLPTLGDALRILRVLPRNATGQAMTSYLTWITGAVQRQAGGKQTHVVFLDNGRRDMARDPDFSQVLRCVRCGACANVCPVYRAVGGHRFGHVYIGAVGLVLTYFLHGRDKARRIVENCINCQACKQVCAAGIDLPDLIAKLHARIRDEDGPGLPGTLLSLAMRDRKMFHGLLRAARFAQKPLGEKRDGRGRKYLRHLPGLFARKHAFRELPPIVGTPFRDRLPALRRGAGTGRRIALFAGCAGDFIYPEHLEAALRTVPGGDAAVDFPMEQTCCGLPLLMMGESLAARKTATQNLRAFEDSGAGPVLCLCPSCVAHLKSYPELFAPGEPEHAAARRLAGRAIDYASFMRDHLQVGPEQFLEAGPRAAYHAPCHLHRSLGVRDAPRELLQIAGMEYAPMDEEEVCCGFGGSYTLKFPRVSERILENKLDAVERSGARLLVTDCPGCVMQIRGGLARRNSKIRVRHMSEILDEQRKK